MHASNSSSTDHHTRHSGNTNTYTSVQYVPAVVHPATTSCSQRAAVLYRRSLYFWSAPWQLLGYHSTDCTQGIYPHAVETVRSYATVIANVQVKHNRKLVRGLGWLVGKNDNSVEWEAGWFWLNYVCTMEARGAKISPTVARYLDH